MLWNQSAAQLVCPTVVYEDELIRSGGTDTIEPLDAPPYVRIRRRLAGMPVSLIADTEPQPSVTASLACCLMPREVARGLAAAMPVTTTPSMQEADLFLKLRQDGFASFWMPGARVYAADLTLPDSPESGARVGQLVDGWCLRARITGEV